MTLSIWRYAHLALAIVSSAFLIILSVTGVILAYDAVDEKVPSYRVDNFEDITLAQVLPTLRDNYFEIIDVKIDHNDFVIIDAMDEEGNPFQSYIDPNTGKKIGEIQPKSGFIQWVTALHRSLFLKEPGRAIVGVVSFLLMLISISGLILIIKRQQGIKNIFSKVHKDFFSQYFHVVTGRWLLIPVLIVAVTGTLIFMARLETFIGEETVIEHQPNLSATPKKLHEIDFFKNTKLRSVERIEFPFIPDDEAEPFIVHLRKKSVTINQVNGEIISETIAPTSAIIEKFNVDLHTGRTNIIWAIILGLASLNILFFIYSGFAIMFRRTKTKISNKYKIQDAEIVLLVGSENGSTLQFANQIHQQLLSHGKKSFLGELNQYQLFPKATQLILFTSTYGLGDPPTNGNTFLNLLEKFKQDHDISYSVVGFGSKSYDDFCAFAEMVAQNLKISQNLNELIPLQTVNDRSPEDFVKWTQLWSSETGIPLVTVPSVYQAEIPKLSTFSVIDKTEISEDNSTFKIVLKGNSKFDSGDLLSIYPLKNHVERFYSIGKINQHIQLVVKLFPNGLGSSFLHQLKVGDHLQGRIMKNKNFHLPKKAQKVIMIANGTGIAPFLGMIANNTERKHIHSYAGFRFENSLISEYKSFADEYKSKNQLKEMHFAFSRENEKQYVMDLIKRDEVLIAAALKEGNVVMICGALEMQKSVEEILNEITEKLNGQNIQYYYSKNQILTDCY